VGFDALPDVLSQVKACRSGAVVEHDQKFFTTPADHRVLASHRIAQGSGHRAQYAVASRMAEAVIHPLEMIDITHYQGQRSPLPCGGVVALV